jgi:hypothetical protein
MALRFLRAASDDFELVWEEVISAMKLDNQDCLRRFCGMGVRPSIKTAQRAISGWAEHQRHMMT